MRGNGDEDSLGAQRDFQRPAASEGSHIGGDAFVELH